MAKHRGRGVAAVNYPIGMNLGGDPSQALVHSNPDGKFTVTLSSIDLGQGMKSVTRQIAAETLGVPVDDVYVDTADSDTGPHCMGSFASRGTHRVGNAVKRNHLVGTTTASHGTPHYYDRHVPMVFMG
ncbi:MAG: molybdopterin cofactor-binding domain-containing protein, partial [Methyloligellaceae bacterium]